MELANTWKTDEHEWVVEATSRLVARSFESVEILCMLSKTLPPMRQELTRVDRVRAEPLHLHLDMGHFGLKIGYFTCLPVQSRQFPVADISLLDLCVHSRVPIFLQEEEVSSADPHYLSVYYNAFFDHRLPFSSRRELWQNTLISDRNSGSHSLTVI